MNSTVPITVDRLRLSPTPSRPRILAFIDFRIGPLVVRGSKVIRGARGQIKIKFPDQPVPVPCIYCRTSIGLNHEFCHHCGGVQPIRVPEKTSKGRNRRYREYVFPVTAADRWAVECLLLDAYLAKAGVFPRPFAPAEAVTA